MTVTLKNHRLTVRIEEMGAQLCSVKDPAGREYIWQADPEIWGRHAPLLFPVIGRLKDGKYTVHGREYAISIHGFARGSLFSVAEQGETRAVFRLEHSEQTLQAWPFPFALTVTYQLEENRLHKSVRVENSGEETMFYELGGHDGFVAPLEPGEVMDDYAIVIPGLEQLTPYGMDEQLMVTPPTLTYPLQNGRIPLKPSAYQLDTIILGDLPQSRACLVDRQGRARVTLDFPGFPYLGLWTQGREEDTNYVCIEPWSTLPDAVFVGRGLEDKRGIRTLQPGQSEVLQYTTTFD